MWSCDVSAQMDASRACLAQLVEHLICNRRVSGSNPLTGMGLWKETALMRNLFPQVHLATTRHRRCREELSLWCSLDADASGASDERPRGSHQLHHYGDVRQLGAPPACEAGASRFDPGTSHWLTPFAYRLSEHNKHYLQDNLRTLLGSAIKDDSVLLVRYADIGRTRLYSHGPAEKLPNHSSRE